jgi:hypothetical protein
MDHDSAVRRAHRRPWLITGGNVQKINHALVAAAITVGALAWAAPAQAAPSKFTATRGPATATGQVKMMIGWPGSVMIWGTLSVSANDGLCYYVRAFEGTGTNSARQCGTGSVSLSTVLPEGTDPFALVLGLCSTTPGAPQESSTTPPGANCTII